MQIAVLTATRAAPLPETVLAIQRAQMEVLHYGWDEPLESWLAADGYVLLAPREVALTKAAAQDLVDCLIIQSAKGKPILGLGYGAAKFLVDNGLVPGLYKNLLGLDVVKIPLSGQASSEVVLRLSDDYQYNAFTRCLTPRDLLAFQLTTAAQFVIPPGLFIEIEAQGLNVFLYCDSSGQALAGRGIAALANKAGNVMALLPHPEKVAAGDALFQSLKTYLDSGYREQVEPLYYWPRK